MKYIRRPVQFLSDVAARITIVLTVIGAVILVGALVLQVFFRYVLGSALPWSEELALLVFTWTVLLTGSLGVRENFLARLTLVSDALPRLPRVVLDKLTDIAIAIFGVFVCYSGYILQSATSGQFSPAIRYPISLLYTAAPVAGVLITIHALANLLSAPKFKQAASSLEDKPHD